MLLIAAQIAAIIFLCLFIPSYLPVAAAAAGIWLLNIAAVSSAISRGTSPEINCALALFIVALPVAGAVIYFIAARSRKGRGALNITNANPQGGLEKAAYAACGICGAEYDKAVYLKDGEEFFRLLFKEIESAQRYVYLEYFIVSRGKIFTRLISSLRKAQKNGAEIKIITDGIGSAFKMGRREKKTLKSLGAQIKFFHRLTPFPRSKLNFRDHRKIAAIDGRVAFTGGINLADEYANIKSPYGHWKDTAVAIYGEAAKIFEGMFLAQWKGKHEMSIESGAGQNRCLPFFDGPPKRAGFCENAYATAIASARERVHIFTPYFCAGEKLSSALAFAAERGVDVKIIIPHVPDKKYAFALSKASAKPLADRGVKFYEYTPGFMHAKSMVCDDRTFIGSYNLDHRSMRLNFECGVTLCGEFTEEAERDFKECIRLSSPLHEGKISAWQKFVRFILKLFAPLM
ncbi:MAG: hypothetical protein K2K60_01170 [Clostridia bacterium]|nr:hypothetical protein [Clostridia bacterium]